MSSGGDSLGTTTGYAHRLVVELASGMLRSQLPSEAGSEIVGAIATRSSASSRYRMNHMDKKREMMMLWTVALGAVMAVSAFAVVVIDLLLHHGSGSS